MEESIRKSAVLIEALPYIQAFAGKTIVVKYGGSALERPKEIRRIVQDLVFLSIVGLRPILLHGGGPTISKRMASVGKAARFIDGMRVTDGATIRIVNHALSELNAHLVSAIRALGGLSQGFVPRQRVIRAQPHPNAHQLGYVGVVQSIQTAPLRRALTRGAIPVLSPVGVDGARLYNINADEAASAVAASLKAEKLVLLTNVQGIFRHPDDPSTLIPTLSIREADTLMRRGVIQHGMIPKVRACIHALRRGVKKTHMINASIPHALLLEIFTKTGIGTEIVR